MWLATVDTLIAKPLNAELGKGSILQETGYNKNGRITKIKGSVNFHRKLASLGLFCGSAFDSERLKLQSGSIRVRTDGDYLELSQR